VAIKTIEIVNAGVSLERMTRVVRHMAEDLQGEARWDGTTFYVQFSDKDVTTVQSRFKKLRHQVKMTKTLLEGGLPHEG